LINQLIGEATKERWPKQQSDQKKRSQFCPGRLFGVLESAGQKTIPPRNQKIIFLTKILFETHFFFETEWNSQVG
jgi:hypothetical protein